MMTCLENLEMQGNVEKGKNPARESCPLLTSYLELCQSLVGFCWLCFALLNDFLSYLVNF